MIRRPVAALAAVVAAGVVGLASAGWCLPAPHDCNPTIPAAVDRGLSAPSDATP